jgi:hypothetical protein
MISIDDVSTDHDNGDVFGEFVVVADDMIVDVVVLEYVLVVVCSRMSCNSSGFGLDVASVVVESEVANENN